MLDDGAVKQLLVPFVNRRENQLTLWVFVDILLFLVGQLFGDVVVFGLFFEEAKLPVRM